MAYQDRLEAYDERHADDMAEYQEQQAEYEKKLAAWQKQQADRTRVGESAAGAHGFVETFQAMKESDPEAYQAARLANVRFEAFAAAFEQGLPKALELEPKIDAEIKAAQLYETKTEERPRQLTEQQQLRIAKELHALAAETKAEEEKRLRTAIEYNKALANATGSSLTATKAWEKLLETGATVAGTKAATHKATEALFDAIARQRPEVYEKHLDRFEPVEYKKTPSGRMVPVSVNIQLDEITPEISQAVQAAMQDVVMGQVDQRRDDEVAEARNLEPTPTQTEPEAVGPAAALPRAGPSDHTRAAPGGRIHWGPDRPRTARLPSSSSQTRPTRPPCKTSLWARSTNAGTTRWPKPATSSRRRRRPNRKPLGPPPRSPSRSQRPHPSRPRGPDSLGARSAENRPTPSSSSSQTRPTRPPSSPVCRR